MTVYSYYVSDASDIANKINIINTRIDLDPEIIPARLSTVYNDPDITVTFNMPLDDKERRLLDCIFSSAINGSVSGINYNFNNNVGIARDVINANISPTTQYDIYGGFNIGSTIYSPTNNNIFLCLDPTPDIAQWMPINAMGPTGNTGPTGPIGTIIYNSGGVVTDSKIWTGTVNTSGGSATFNISSANFTNIIGVTTSLRQTASAVNQPWDVITAQSNTSITVSLYNTTFSGVTILGINVIGSATPQLYTTPVPVSITVIGT